MTYGTAALSVFHVVDRFTPLDAQTIRYEFTVDDPDTWTSSWSGEMELRRTGGPTIAGASTQP